VAGEYLIAPDGTVRDKLFLPSYEHRASATEVIFRKLWRGRGRQRGGNQVERAGRDGNAIDRSRFSRSMNWVSALDIRLKARLAYLWQAAPEQLSRDGANPEGDLVDELTI